MTKRFAVYGGSFNPFGNNHFEVLRYLVTPVARGGGGFDKVIVVPAAAHALKPDLLPFVHRLNMARLGVAATRHAAPSFPVNRSILVSTIEADLLQRQPAPVYTRDLMRALQQAYAFDHGDGVPSLHIAIGADVAAELDRWHAAEALEREFGFHQIPVRGIHATEVRSMIAADVAAWRRAVPPAVARYIEMHGLYRRHAA